jgi:hypothetical protein
MQHQAFLMFLLIGVNHLFAQQKDEVPTPDYKNWPCFYIEGKPETWNLEKHSSIAYTLGGDLLKMDYQVKFPKGAIQYTLEGAKSGVIIKSSDSYEFILMKSVRKDEMEDLKKSSMIIEKAKKMLDETTDRIERSFLKDLIEDEQKKMEEYNLKLYKLKTTGENRTFYATDSPIPCKIESLPNGMEKIIPLKKLTKGEYAFSKNGFEAYTFRIEE